MGLTVAPRGRRAAPGLVVCWVGAHTPSTHHPPSLSLKRREWREEDRDVATAPAGGEQSCWPHTCHTHTHNIIIIIFFFSFSQANCDKQLQLYKYRVWSRYYFSHNIISDDIVISYIPRFRRLKLLPSRVWAACLFWRVSQWTSFLWQIRKEESKHKHININGKDILNRLCCQFDWRTYLTSWKMRLR